MPRGSTPARAPARRLLATISYPPSLARRLPPLVLPLSHSSTLTEHEEYLA